MTDQMSEQEAVFLNGSLPLFRNVQDRGRATPRANTSLVRAYRPKHFIGALSATDDVLHIIAHGDAKQLDIGGASHVTADDLARRAAEGLRMPEVVISTACKFSTKAWHETLQALGVRVLIASASMPTPANLTAFDMSFYSALLSQVRKGKTTLERVQKSFALADAHYRAIHAHGTPYAKFSLAIL